MVTYLKSASDASYDVINMATINKKCSLIKAIACVVFSQHERFYNLISIIKSYDGQVKALHDFDNKLFLDNYILHAKYCRFPITIQLGSRPEMVRIFMITKTHDWSVFRKRLS